MYCENIISDYDYQIETANKMMSKILTGNNKSKKRFSLEFIFNFLGS